MTLQRLASVLLVLFMAVQGMLAQKVAFKTNLISDALLSPNVGIEVSVAPKMTLDFSGEFNLWKLSGDKQWRHVAFQPELRYWLCDRFAGHFFGVHLLGGQYNIGGINTDFKLLGTDFSKLRNTRFQGWFGGAGVAYGYDWILGKNWNLEAVIGLGWTYTRYDQFRCTGCGKKIKENTPHNYFGPTKVAINIEYLF